MGFILKKRALLFLLLLFACGIKFTWGLYHIIDISLVDEHAYLLNGIQHHLKADYSPLYELWYWLLSHFTGNNAELMFLNSKLLTLLFPVFLYLFLNKLKIDPLFCFILSFLILISIFNLPLYPKVAIFMNLMILAILYVAVSDISTARKNRILLILLFISRYIRPEYKQVFWIFFLYLLCYQLWEYRKQRKTSGLLSLVLPVALLIILSIPPKPDSKDEDPRFYVALSQHFAKNYVKWNHLDTDPWTNSDVIFSKNFGNARSFTEALTANRQMLFKHIRYNIQNYSWRLTHLMAEVFVPLHYLNYPAWQLILFLLSVAAIGVYYRMNYTLRITKDTLITAFKKYQYPILLGVLLLIPGTVSAVLIAPRYHYLSMQLPEFTAMLAIFFLSVSSKKESANNTTTRGIYLAIPLLIFLITPSPAENKYLTTVYAGRPNMQLVEKLNALPIKDSGLVSLNAYLLNFSKYSVRNNVVAWKKKINFNKYLSDNNINFILSDKIIRENNKYANDPDWKNFIAHPDNYQFIQFPLDSNRIVYIREDLVKQ